MLTLYDAQLLVAQAISNIKYNNSPIELYAPMQYILELGGKRIRPALTILGCNLFSDDVSPSVDAAIGLELFHNFTLIHDDIMDNALLRRGEPVIHNKWNNNVAILSGDGMCIKAYEQIAKCPAPFLQKVLDIFNKTALEVCEGQQYDMNFESRHQVTMDEYLNMIGLKTSVLLGACIKIGAVTGGANNNDADLMYNFGLNIGLGFQLQDDLLDVFGDQQSFGKEIGKDIIANKKTYLLIAALSSANNTQKTELLNWLQTPNFNPNEKIAAVTAIYNDLKIEQATKAEINRYFSLASKNLDNVCVPANRKIELQQFLAQIQQRKF